MLLSAAWVRVRGVQLDRVGTEGSRSGDVEYVRGTRVDLTCLYKLDAPARPEWRDCDPLGSWPTPELLEVDDSQQHALRQLEDRGCIFKVDGETNTDDLSPAGDAWSDGTSAPPLASELEAVQSAMRPRLR